MEIISYPGPVPGIEMKHLQPGASVPPVPNRNRRIGEFLKDLDLAEGRGTGIPKIRRKMNENGSPEPIFEFDEARTYFRIILPAHPQYIVIHALRESALLWAVGDRRQAILNLQSASRRVPKSGALVAQIIEYTASIDGLGGVEHIFADVESDLTISDRHLPYIAMAKILLDHNNPKRASEILTHIPSPTKVDDLVELAVLHRRSGHLREAHSIFASNYDLIKDIPKAVHEYAQIKTRLAADLPKSQIDTKRRLNRDAVELLRRAIQLSGDDNVRSAWCWYDLARALSWLRSPDIEVLQAYSKAMELLPYEPRFKESYESWKQKKKGRIGL
jgi:ATP-dependent DNA helicase RecG